MREEAEEKRFGLKYSVYRWVLCGTESFKNLALVSNKLVHQIKVGRKLVFDSFFVNQHVYVVSTIKSGPVKAFHVTRP